ncbi:MarR family winged helix-turn-helix transcriptional regulator [Streptomyces sp. NRRL S-118]|uniref:MarR family winged helix-turn-helix transcriptional regulator n=1 Tax=Streptomyces sp. NRRL S-118 TaxID=1463881 RepID=UPI000694AF5F|nr:MarR family transcriptional regulator [Streptomyces sp. NRRL S-118]
MDVKARRGHGSAAGPTARSAPAELAEQATRLTSAMDATVNAEAARHGLTRADFDVLAALRAAPDHRLKPTELSSLCRLSSGGTSNVIRRMTESGYVVREADLYDGRSSWAQLTEEGTRVCDRVQETVDGVHARLLAGLPPGVVDALTALLAQAVDALESGA